MTKKPAMSNSWLGFCIQVSRSGFVGYLLMSRSAILINASRSSVGIFWTSPDSLATGWGSHCQYRRILSGAHQDIHKCIRILPWMAEPSLRKCSDCTCDKLNLSLFYVEKKKIVSNCVKYSQIVVFLFCDFPYKSVIPQAIDAILDLRSSLPEDQDRKKRIT